MSMSYYSITGIGADILELPLDWGKIKKVELELMQQGNSSEEDIQMIKEMNEEDFVQEVLDCSRYFNFGYLLTDEDKILCTDKSEAGICYVYWVAQYPWAYRGIEKTFESRKDVKEYIYNCIEPYLIDGTEKENILDLIDDVDDSYYG